jgi:LPS-assembly protein
MAPVALLTFLVLGAEPAPFQVAGDEQLSDGQRRLTHFDGHARLSTEGVAVNADRLTYDEAHQAATAVGNVVARVVEGDLIAIIADVVTLRFEDGQVKHIYFADGTATARTAASPSAFLAADTVEALGQVSKVAALMKGNHLERSDGRWTFEQVSLVPCDCDFERPSWSVQAPWAAIDTDAKRVSLVSPVVRVYRVPVLWLPWLSLPLSERQTGLLFPRPGVMGQNGLSFEQPLFITLGRSADLTLTPGYFGGTEAVTGVRGPRLGTEFNYALSGRAKGRIVLGLLYDLRAQRDPFDVAWTALPQEAEGLLRVETKVRGLRGELAWTHQQTFDGGWGARVDLSAHSDGFYFRDITTDVLASQAGYLRSTAWLLQRGVDHLVTADVTLRQAVGFGYGWLGTSPLVRKDSTPAYGPGTIQRFPAITASIPLRRLAGPLWLDVSADSVRLAPLFSNTGDEGQVTGWSAGTPTASDGTELPLACQVKRLFGPGTQGGTSDCALAFTKTGQGDRRWQLGEREARDRLHVVPRLHLAGTLAGIVGVSATAWWREAVWYGEASGRSWQRGALVLDAKAETELSGTLPGGWRHVVTPLVEVRMVPLVVKNGWGANATQEPVAYDEIDAAIPAGGAARAQGMVVVQQRLKRSGSGDGFQLDLGQGVDFLKAGGPALAEGWARFVAKAGLFGLSAVARVAPGETLSTPQSLTVVPVRLTRLAAQVRLDDGKGRAAWASYSTMLDDGTDRTRSPIDLLFGEPVPPTVHSRAHAVAAGVAWDFGPVAVAYTAQLFASVWTGQDGNLFQHALSAGLKPACDCWRVDVSASQALVREATTHRVASLAPTFGLSVTVSRFGTLGVR